MMSIQVYATICLCNIQACNALFNLVTFAQFKKRQKHPWRSVTFNKVPGFSLQKVTPLWVFFTFCKLYKCYQITQNISYTFKRNNKNTRLIYFELIFLFYTPWKSQKNLWFSVAFRRFRKEILA